jgi:ubiquinone/menaquinone biosynthesis C-methylase UbiE
MEDIYDPKFVKAVFDRCSDRYITFSLICSFGFTERWRRQCVAAMPALPAKSANGYDLMAGTGEVWPHLLRRFDGIKAVTAVDISSGMHRRAMERLHAHRAHRIEFIEDDLLASDLPSESADFVISTFARVLKPGGVFSMIEASDPKGWWLRPLYLFHLKVILPLVERTLLRGAQDFSMIGTYSTNFGSAAELAAMLRSHGLEVEYSKYFFGCATGVSGRRRATG